jgi:ATP-dependent Lon protease
VLEQNSCEKRTAMMEKMVYEYLEITKITNEAETEQKKDYEKLYRQEAIKKQMQYLQKELDEMDPENVSDIRRLELAVEESGMNEEAKKEAGKVLSRLKQEGQHSQEAGMLYDYLDFMAQLPWKKEKAKAIDLDEAEKVLDEDHFGLKKVKQRIVQQVAVMNLQHKQSGSILLFVGAPGTGKTSIGKSIAKALGREYVRVSLGGVRDEADIRGHRRTYIGAMPGRIMDGIHKAGVSNPVMVLDEVDKLSMSYNGDPASALLEVLDPEQNNTFTDHYANVPYDLSDVFFICTANSLDTIPEPLLNRMEVIQFEGYTATDKFQIAKRHLLPRAYAAMGIDEERLMLPDETLRAIISDYTMEAGVRGLKKRIDTLCRAAAVQIVKGEGEQLTIVPDELRDYLDMRPVTHDHILAKKKPGIVTGLAWTRVGGEILFIETLMTAGSGKVIITGQLGDVMKESVQIAVSLVKAMFPEQAEKFEKNDLHVHVPAGAVPKDGPSAGITLTTAIASLVCQKAVSPEFAMTGEVSLRGVVTPIGGLPEKLMAAQRAGIQRVFIPKDNVDDLKDVADEVKARLTVIPVGTVQEVLEKTGVIGEMQDTLKAV